VPITGHSVGLHLSR